MESWKNSFFKTPGPFTGSEALLLFIKGLAMGSADIIPGVSGGTIAFITGIYHKLLAAIQSLNAESLKLLFSFRIKEFLALIHLRFLLVLGSGILIALLSLARVMHYLLKTYPVFTWSLFFGLIIASIILIGKNIKNWKGSGGLGFVTGTVGGFFLVGAIPVNTPEAWWFIVLSGMIAICAMILPGISGAFLLLILGKYELITGALKNPFIASNIVILAFFALGCVIGLAGFSRILTYMLEHFQNITMALLTGLMAGSLRKIWPWKEVLEQVTIRNKVHVLREQNILPDNFSQEVIIAIALAIVGFLLISSMDYFASRKTDHI